VNEPLWLFFSYSAPFRFYVADIPLKTTWDVTSFLFIVRLSRNSSKFSWAETFSQVRLTSKAQCPELDKKKAVQGIYQVWPSGMFNESADTVTLNFEVDTDFSSQTNTTRLYLGILLNEQESHFGKNSIFSISVDVKPIPIPPDNLELWAIILTLGCSIIVLILVAVIAIWSKSHTSEYLPLS